MTTAMRTDVVKAIATTSILNGIHKPFNETIASTKWNSTTPDTSESGSVSSSNHFLASFLADYAFNMSQQTSKRGKRRNAVDLYMSSTSALQETIKQEYDGIMFDTNNVDKTDIEIHLFAATCTLEQFVNAQGSICVMSEYLPNTLQEEGYPTPQAHILSLIESYIFTQFSNFLQDLNGIQSLIVAAWINDAKSKLEQLCPNVKLSPMWLSEYEKLTAKFLEHGVRSKMKHVLNLIAGARWSDSTCSKHIENQYMEDLAFVVDEHLKIAKSIMKESFVSRVMEISNDVLSATVSETMVELCTKWMSIETNRMCHIIDDASQLSEFLEQRNKLYLDHHETNDIANRAIQDLHELSMCSVNLLSERMMFDLQHSVATLSSIGSPEWEHDEKGAAIVTTLKTFRPMLVRVYNWLSCSKYFPMLLKNALNMTLQSYMESFYSNTMTHGVTNPATVAANLNNDYVSMVTFFNGSLFEQYQGVEGFYSTCEINQRLQVIQCIARLINPDVPPSELEDDAAQLLTLSSDNVGNPNTAAILHIAGLRSNHCVEASADWLHMIKTLERTVDEHQQPMYDSINLPDLRNSLYVSKMQLNHRFDNQMIQRHISSVLSFSGDSKSALGKLIRTQARKVIM